MTNRDILIIIAISNVATELIEDGMLTKEECTNCLDGCNFEQMIKSLELSNEDAVKELKIMLKEYGNMIREEQNKLWNV